MQELRMHISFHSAIWWLWKYTFLLSFKGLSGHQTIVLVCGEPKNSTGLSAFDLLNFWSRWTLHATLIIWENIQSL